MRCSMCAKCTRTPSIRWRMTCIAVLKAYAEVDKATGGKADLPMLSVLQSIRDHIATLVYPGFIGRTPPDALKSLSRYLRADLSRLNKAKTDKNRDVKWAWQADEARQVVDKALARAKAEPAGPKHEALMKQAEQARWMLEEFYVSLWAQELGTKGPAGSTVSRKRWRDRTANKSPGHAPAHAQAVITAWASARTPRQSEQETQS